MTQANNYLGVTLNITLVSDHNLAYLRLIYGDRETMAKLNLAEFDYGAGIQPNQWCVFHNNLNIFYKYCNEWDMPLYPVRPCSWLCSGFCAVNYRIVFENEDSYN